MDNWELGRWISFIGLGGRALLSEWGGGGIAGRFGLVWVEGVLKEGFWFVFVFVWVWEQRRDERTEGYS